MGLQRKEITVLDFDHTCAEQTSLLAHFPHRRVDLSRLSETNLYCSAATFQRLRGALPPAAPQGVTLIGCGNFHYVALALLPLTPRPFTLVLVDHHADCTEGLIPSMLSCGSWIRHAFLRLRGLARVVMVGPSATAAARLPAGVRRRITLFTDTERLTPARLLAAIPTADVHLSIDKDALAPDQACTNWDQGNLRLPHLLGLVAAVVRVKNVCGADLCGEWPATPLELLRPEARAARALNEHANTLLLQALLATG